MSHMGAVIKAVRRLFMNKGEMLAAHNRDVDLYKAALRFNREIDSFEIREKERTKMEISTLQKTMKEARLTVEELASLLGVSRSMIYKWIKGAPPHKLRLARMDKILMALSIAITEGLLPLNLEPNTKTATKEARMLAIKSIVIKCLKTAATGL